MTDSLDTLDERSKNIIQRRWLNEDKATLHELAAEYDVSAERIRQIEKNALGKMRVAFQVRFQVLHLAFLQQRAVLTPTFNRLTAHPF